MKCVKHFGLIYYSDGADKCNGIMDTEFGCMCIAAHLVILSRMAVWCEWCESFYYLIANLLQFPNQDSEFDEEVRFFFS